MNHKPALMILAAGMGSRYGSLKQLDAFGPAGETLMDYAIYDAVKAGFGKVVFIIRREMEKEFSEVITAKIAPYIPVELVFQESGNLPDSNFLPANRTKPWGTGHAVWSAAGKLHESFAVINADDFYGASAFKQVAFFLQNSPDAFDKPSWCLVGYPLINTLSPNGSVARGLCEVDSNGNLISVKELKEITMNGTGPKATLPDGKTLSLSGQETVSMNFWGFSPAVFPVLEKYLIDFLEGKPSEKAEFYLSEAVNRMLQENIATIRVLPSGDNWMGVTYSEDKETVKTKLAELTAQGYYPPGLFPATGKN